MFLFISSLVIISNALAQEDLDKEEKVKSFEELGFVPPFRVTIFQDRPESGDCDPVAARFGKCIELVDFYQPTPFWFWADEYELLSDEQKKSQDTQIEKQRMLFQYPDYQRWFSVTDEKARKKIRRGDRATQRLVAELYAETWETIVFQWKEKDAAALAMNKDGFRVTPNPEIHWGYQPFPDRGTSGVVNPEYYLAGADWFQSPTGERDPALADLQNKPAFFGRVKQAFPEAYIAQKIPSVIMSGRFAERLGYNNKVYDFNIMDADPQVSGPFFEQLYPYQNIYQAEDKKFIPLVDFDYPSESAKIKGLDASDFIQVEGFSAAEEKASAQFDKFYHLVSSQILQFAMQDYTDNHMRILGSITMMRSPPSSLEEATGISRNLNASAQGQTDSDAQLEERVNAAAYSVPGGFRLNYDKIPDILVVQWLQQLSSTYTVDSEFYFNLTLQAETQYHQLLNSTRPTILKGVGEEQLQKWIAENAKTGVDGNVILKGLRRLAIKEFMSFLPEIVRDKEETWLLLDHVNYSVISQLDNTVGIRISPSDITGLVSTQWETVLSTHYYQTRKIEQGLGAVDPTAVCTTLNRREALAEPTIGAVYFDQIFAGEDSKLKPDLTGDQLLWQARNDIPVLMFDNPSVAKPSVERLVGLPDGQALYRARWTLWSGWHLMWGVEQIEEKHRLALKTGAICDNMVLAPPDLVPTIVRAGLLEYNFYPTLPPKYGDKSDAAPPRKKRKREQRKAKPVDLKSGVTKTVATAKNTDTKVERIEGAIEEPTMLQVQNAANVDLSSMPQRPSAEKPVAIDLRESVDYVKGIVHQPLRDISAREKGLLVLVEDIDQPSKPSLLYDTLAHSPYSRGYEMAGFQQVKGAAWSFYFPGIPEEKIVRAAPNYVPRANYQLNAIVPNFKRQSTTDIGFVGDIGLFPLRATYYSCNPSVNENTKYSAKSCDPNALYEIRTDGLFIGGSSYRTQWFRDDPRIAYELGLSIQLDILHAGKSWFHSQSLPTMESLGDRFAGGGETETDLYPTYSWAFRPQTGASFGFRHLIDPFPLSRMIRAKETWATVKSSGGSFVQRTEWGIRGGFLVGPSFNGLEGSLLGELWATGLIRSPSSDWAYFSPYHPILTGGPFLQYKRGGVLMPAEELQMFNMVYSDTIVVGWRTQFRLREDRPE